MLEQGTIKGNYVLNKQSLGYGPQTTAARRPDKGTCIDALVKVLPHSFGERNAKAKGIQANLPHFLALMVLLVLMVLVLELRLFAKDTWAIIVAYNHQIISHLDQNAPS